MDFDRKSEESEKVEEMEDRRRTKAETKKKKRIINKNIKMDRNQIKILSVHVNSLNEPVNQKKTLLQLNKLNVDLGCLQETHMKKENLTKNCWKIKN